MENRNKIPSESKRDSFGNFNGNVVVADYGQARRTNIQFAPCPPCQEHWGKVSPLESGIVFEGCFERL